MAKRKQKATTQTQAPQIEDIPESEQWRIIEETGVLKKVPREWRESGGSSVLKEREGEANPEDDEPFSPLCNEIFNAIFFAIPFSTLYITMDVMAHRQYSQPITTLGLLEKIVWGIPFLFAFIFYTLRHKADRRTQALLFFLSIACGARLIYIVNWESWRVVVNQCAPLGTIWVYTVAQLNLIPAVAALAVVAAYVKWKELKIVF
ncbi:uncharacterized protein FOMMEDRAFT_30051 [Fomitiporia mediterranea MF3/22]|uniref:uncharacterized protein n=1 Tax=Fomitiporia mediterranea (strain MF3/22) TaxID=694068 RepID=UPI00044088B2|nr:uncharacterized protein FOMMEDRAFT_30051 [Fomitiporia mediterranea MF3/22]EJD01340.1 hypothetical protein FOMMEDRAFT_30051 [Fomitiporia mediterranea MF3/22]